MSTDETAPQCVPLPGVKYPLVVEYCPNCSMPFEVSSEVFVAAAIADASHGRVVASFSVLRILPGL